MASGSRRDGKWRCGHEKTPENTVQRVHSQPHGRCRLCYAASWSRYRRSDKGRELQRKATARYTRSPLGLVTTTIRNYRRRLERQEGEL